MGMISFDQGRPVLSGVFAFAQTAINDAWEKSKVAQNAQKQSQATFQSPSAIVAAPAADAGVKQAENAYVNGARDVLSVMPNVGESGEIKANFKGNLLILVNDKTSKEVVVDLSKSPKLKDLLASGGLEAGVQTIKFENGKVADQKLANGGSKLDPVILNGVLRILRKADAEAPPVKTAEVAKPELGDDHKITEAEEQAKYSLNRLWLLASANKKSFKRKSRAAWVTLNLKTFHLG